MTHKQTAEFLAMKKTIMVMSEAIAGLLEAVKDLQEKVNESKGSK